MQNDLIVSTDTVSAKGVGFDYPLTYALPLAQALQVTIYVRYFLDNVFAAVIVLLLMLGMLLIYSLLLNDADARTYEFGMLRALGMKRRTLVQLLVTKSLLFSVLGIAFGLFLAFLANIPMAMYLVNFAAVSPSFELPSTPLIVSVLLGLVLPLLANAVPIRRALGRTLRDSLDVYHVVLSEVSVRMIRLENLGIDLWQTCLSIMMIVVGFVCFYILPWALTFKMTPVFLAVL